MASTDSNSEIASGSTAEPEAGPPLLQMYSAKNDRNGLRAQTSASQEKGNRGMENFLLFVLSSSCCTLVASVMLLLRPLVGLP
jgi:hypothetical protein